MDKPNLPNDYTESGDGPYTYTFFFVHFISCHDLHCREFPIGLTVNRIAHSLRKRHEKAGRPRSFLMKFFIIRFFIALRNRCVACQGYLSLTSFRFTVFVTSITRKYVFTCFIDTARFALCLHFVYLFLCRMRLPSLRSGSCPLDQSPPPARNVNKSKSVMSLAYVLCSMFSLILRYLLGI